MKKLLKIVAVLILLVVAVVIVLIFSLDGAVKRAVERGGTYALGVQTTLDSAALRPLRGECTIDGLSVANPPGYDAERFLGLGSGSIDVSLGSLTKDVIEVPSLTLDDVEINLEKRGGKANYEVILDNLEKLEKGEPAPEEKGEGKKYVIRELVISNVTATVSLQPEGADISRITVPVDEIRLQNVGSGGKPVGTREIASIVVKAIFASIAANPQLPGEITKGINTKLAQLEDIRKQGEAVAGQVDEARKKLEETGKSIDEATKQIGNLLGGQKDKK